mmetsp:Transcript_1517/g.4140  ORF Transcript_1517/g.4140 Transcript_1517/m.4140 type:complete len:300 (-) Transcript_1517:2749-3648(-)
MVRSAYPYLRRSFLAVLNVAVLVREAVSSLRAISSRPLPPGLPLFINPSPPLVALRRRSCIRLASSSAAAAVPVASAPVVVVYSRAGCQFCRRAKELLESRGIEYLLVDVEAEPDRFDEARERAGQNDIRTVPQIFINGGYVGGYDDLSALAEKKDQLEGRVREAERLPESARVLIHPTPSEKIGNIPGWDKKLDDLAHKLKGMKEIAVTRPLNLFAEPSGEPRDALKMSSALRRVYSLIEEKTVDGGSVDYSKLESIDEWFKYLALAVELQSVEGLEKLTDVEKRAFFINLYNCLTFH